MKTTTQKTTKTSPKKSTKKKVPIREGIILKQRYEGVFGGIMRTNLGVFDSIEAFCKFWKKNFKEPFSNSPFDPECRRDGLYLEKVPLASPESNMKELLERIHPVNGWQS